MAYRIEKNGREDYTIKSGEDKPQPSGQLGILGICCLSGGFGLEFIPRDRFF